MQTFIGFYLLLITYYLLLITLFGKSYVLTKFTTQHPPLTDNFVLAREKFLQKTSQWDNQGIRARPSPDKLLLVHRDGNKAPIDKQYFYVAST